MTRFQAIRLMKNLDGFTGAIKSLAEVAVQALPGLQNFFVVLKVLGCLRTSWQVMRQWLQNRRHFRQAA